MTTCPVARRGAIAMRPRMSPIVFVSLFVDHSRPARYKHRLQLPIESGLVRTEGGVAKDGVVFHTGGFSRREQEIRFVSGRRHRKSVGWYAVYATVFISSLTQTSCVWSSSSLPPTRPAPSKGRSAASQTCARCCHRRCLPCSFLPEPPPEQRWQPRGRSRHWHQPFHLLQYHQAPHHQI